MKRAVLCVPNPQDYIDQLTDYSIMIVNPDSPDSRKQYLLDRADWSLKISSDGHEYRSGNDYADERLFWYTSGTTGDSKFCSFTQSQLDHLAHTICRAYNITSDDRYVSIMPLWHSHGQGFYWASRLAGCKTNFVTIKNIKNIVEYAPTFITAVPDVLNVIGRFKFDNLRFIRSASAALPDQLYCDLRTKFNVPVIEAFGMTESLSHCFTNPLYGEQRMGTIGFPDGIDADIIDTRLYIRGTTLFTNDWYDTGDLAQRDNDGYYKIIGRFKDQINIKGIKINPVSIEQQLLEAIPEIQHCVIFGHNQVKCLIVGDVAHNKIQNFLTSLGKHCRASQIQVVDSIPISPSGKVSRSWLDTNY